LRSAFSGIFSAPPPNIAVATPRIILFISFWKFGDISYLCNMKIKDGTDINSLPVGKYNSRDLKVIKPIVVDFLVLIENGKPIIKIPLI
jgi:hypothetical protein